MATPQVKSVSELFAHLIRDPIAIRWFIATPVAFFVTSTTLRLCGLSGRTKHGSSEAHVMSYEVVAGVILVYLTYQGFGTWLGYFGDIKLLEGGNPYQDSEDVRVNILIPMMVYQFWNLICCSALKEFSDIPSLAHHFIAMLLSFFCQAPVWLYYATYFLACSEISTIPLTIVDIFAKFPRFRTRWEGLNAVSRVLFVASFMAARVFYFPYLDLRFWRHCYRVISNNEYVHSYPVFYFFLISNIFMTGLQFFWASKMLGFLRKTFSSQDQKSTDKQK
jgi:hypothetical protein